MRIFHRFILFILTIQERFLFAEAKKVLSGKQTSKKKRFYNNGNMLSLDSLAETEKNRMEEEILLLLKSYDFNPQELLNYIAKHDTQVAYIKNPVFLHLIYENEGFIYPQKGLKALYLSFLLDKKLRFKTNELFVLSNKEGEINKYYFIYHFYNWYAYKHNIFGIDNESFSMLNKLLYNATEESINKLKLSDIYKLKNAVEQDKASINFVLKLCQKYDSSKKALEKLKTEGTSI